MIYNRLYGNELWNINWIREQSTIEGNIKPKQAFIKTSINIE